MSHKFEEFNQHIFVDHSKKSLGTNYPIYNLELYALAILWLGFHDCLVQENWSDDIFVISHNFES